MEKSTEEMPRKKDNTQWKDGTKENSNWWSILVIGVMIVVGLIPYAVMTSTTLTPQPNRSRLPRDWMGI